MQNVARLAQENTHLKGQVSQLESYIEQLEQALILARSQRFGASSEQSRTGQLGLFNEAEESAQPPSESTESAVADQDDIQTPAHTRKKRGRTPLPDHLPRVEVIHDLPEKEKVCPVHGTALKLIGDKTSEQLDIIPAKVQVLKHIRKQYTCPCCEGYIVTANKPNQPIEKSQASAGTLAAICVHKYADGLPLYRQARMFERAGIELDRTTLARWMIRCGELVQPLVNLLRDELLDHAIVHVDETPVQVLKETGKTAQSNSYMWVQASAANHSKSIVLFEYAPTRGATVPRRLLEGYQGAILVDGYEAYNGVCRGPSILRLGCWAHARRKFVEANRASKKSTKAAYGLKLINQLYAIERLGKAMTGDERYRLRQDNAQPVLDKLQIWQMQTQPIVPPKLALGKALTYLHNQWPRLIRYLKDGRYPIDNNRVENAIRPFAIGRKNWLFSTSVAGAKASANLYSIIETVRASQVEPYAYLKQVFTELPKADSLEEIEKLLPWNINPESQ